MGKKGLQQIDVSPQNETVRRRMEKEELPSGI